MGLSNEERLDKFYHGMQGMRQHLAGLLKILEKEKFAFGTAEVSNWLSKIDEIVGSQISKTDSSTCYWLFGAKDGNYESLFKDSYDLARQPSSYELRHPSDEQDSFHVWENKQTLDDLAQRLCKDLDHQEEHILRAIAKFWMAWRYVDFLFYAVNRYRDDLFAINAGLIELIGRMANMRYQVCSFSYYAEILPSDLDNVIKIEHALLCKEMAFKLLLEDERDKLGKKAYEKYEADAYRFYSQVAQMSLLDVVVFLKQKEDEKYEKNRNSAGKKEVEEEEKAEGLFGKPIRSKKELEFVLENSNSYEECKKANQEMELAYSCYWGGWELRFKDMETPEETPDKDIPAKDSFDDKINNLILSGKKIEAIKLHRIQTGSGLKEAKHWVDARLEVLQKKA